MMTKVAGDEKCSQVVMIAWALWCNRNEADGRGVRRRFPDYF